MRRVAAWVLAAGVVGFGWAPEPHRPHQDQRTDLLSHRAAHR